MHTRELSPSADLAPWVLGLTFVDAPQGGVRHLVPGPWISVGLRFAGDADLRQGDRWRRLPWRTLAGLQTRARQMRTAPGGLLLVARIHPAAARAFTDDPAGAVDATVPLPLRAPLEPPASERARIEAMEHFLRERLAAWEAPDPLVVHAVDRLRTAGGQLRIHSLARRLGVSPDTLARRMKAATGVTPKQLAAIARLHAALTGSAPDLTARALQAGYFDQPHFNADVRRAMGLAPSAVLAPGTAC